MTCKLCGTTATQASGFCDDCDDMGDEARTGLEWCMTIEASGTEDLLPPVPLDGLAALIRFRGDLEELPALALLDEIQSLRQAR